MPVFPLDWAPANRNVDQGKDRRPPAGERRKVDLCHYRDRPNP